jgi:hypothetical protein
MLLSIIPLADGKGRVSISRRDVDGAYFADHDWSTGNVRVQLDYIADETRDDLKARAIGELGMLDHWPKLRRELAAERRINDAKAGTIRVPVAGDRDGSGLVLPWGLR